MKCLVVSNMIINFSSFWVASGVVLLQVYSKWELEGSHPLSSQIVGLLLVVQHFDYPTSIDCAKLVNSFLIKQVGTNFFQKNFNQTQKPRKLGIYLLTPA